jgi:hypothetical protein
MDVTSTRTQFAPTTPLEPGETRLDTFRGDRATYWREHAWLAAIAMAGGMAILWALGNPHVWTGPWAGFSPSRSGASTSPRTRRGWNGG